MQIGFDIQQDEAIANTMQVSALAGRYLQVFDVPAALKNGAICTDWLADPQTLIVGGGSNILFVRAQIDKVVHLAAATFGYVDELNTVLVWAEGGLGFDDWVRWTTHQGWYGLECLAEIPGTVGAAPIQNVGAYGVQLSDVLVSVDVWDRVQQSRSVLPAAACDFGYRQSCFKTESHRWFILRVTVRLRKTPAPDWPRLSYPGLVQAADVYMAESQRPLALLTPHDLAQVVTRVRRQKLPDWREPRLGSLGSFFQNPVVLNSFAATLKARWPDLPVYPQGANNAPMGEAKLSAAWLIEQAGWRGFSHNNAGIYARHALVLVNLGGATGADLWGLAQRIQADVFARYGVRLVPEPLIINN
ncbi:MAG: UDP-N-acetylenolpyruvoylglucosamine reductase [Halothiobacillus sp. 24-54-40]|jgi:UDP-N-acetylmuramate dehydrogenase|nr:UDP-N-acetylmuramate dehydrogenase [Halothiobacillaceae bacterium]OYV45567.1 MAG: UDP-N-acetylenolpyruvoylglucosamine reductase [Halothiobacillus sp. 20-53-49]OYY32360.1 MAG: UDP-N-acetylenolpyruvoylglucosamine reductase [Halothiobacillus sp. 35-54-62]OYZ85290.1 MAG: UDP-N-acetylenolpyruvoylglucosamine reductase [Halothiobacillus sp. 24-54-40]OZA79619.1 MAG: UDP-N-acetylenolpyruvoylglucosamine reductase [Halothiobacillus sp. 39-53-45]HQS03584.1 UDP-N-acetylmuramate dehydrogenase [Halothioba